jgi:CheY-like chemotaxis protein
MASVILVEDDRFNRTVIEDLFYFDEAPGDLVVFESGEALLAEIESLDPLVVLMDIGLPGLDGVDVTRKLKTNPLTKRIPIWALTAHDSRSEIDRALDAGCAGYFTKPVDTKHLLGQLRALVECRGGLAP